MQIRGSAYEGARCPVDICSAPTEAERRPISLVTPWMGMPSGEGSGL
ncbi:MAG: hypothetical protein K2O32_06005 [Acetatifactor sp.]|nr:hypothetical protein [Acetatifactor sp.]